MKLLGLVSPLKAYKRRYASGLAIAASLFAVSWSVGTPSGTVIVITGISELRSSLRPGSTRHLRGRVADHVVDGPVEVPGGVTFDDVASQSRDHQALSAASHRRRRRAPDR